MIHDRDGTQAKLPVLGAALFSSTPAEEVDAFYHEVLGWERDERGIFRRGSSDVAYVITGTELGWLPVLDLDVDDEQRVSVDSQNQSQPSSPRANRNVELRAAVDPMGSSYGWLIRGHSVPYEPFQPSEGHLSWIQLNADDPPSAAEFYRRAFGWDLGPSDNDKYTYWRFLCDGVPVGGAMKIEQRSGADAAPGWQVYFHAADVATTTDQCSRYGGKILVPPTAIPGGVFSVVTDPLGHVFGLDNMHHDPLPA